MSVLDHERYDLGHLTIRELLWVWRRRQLATNGRLFGRSGSRMSQREAAEALGLSAQAYRLLERGDTGTLSAAEVATIAEPIDRLEPTTGELCQIARRRSEELLVDVYESVGLSRPYYLRLERAGEARAVAFWEERGFRFPRLK